MKFQMNHDFFDSFAVTFTATESVINGVRQPLGYYAAQTLEIDDALLYQLDKKVSAFQSEMHTFLCTPDPLSAALARERLLAVWRMLFRLPVYELMDSERNLPWYLMRYMLEHPDEVDDMVTPGTMRNRMYTDWMDKLTGLTESIRTFVRSTTWMLEDFFDNLPSRSVSSYAAAYGTFRQSISHALETLHDDGEDPGGPVDVTTLEFSFPIQLSYVPVFLANGEGIGFAEQMSFENLVTFLYVDLLKGMSAGNLPRRCRNCGRFFLAIGGYDTLYCNAVAPGEETRTCRMVGAHRAERAKVKSSPYAIKEYKRAYNRLKQRKFRGSISVDEWNEKVSKAQEYKDALLEGKISDAELKRLLDAL